MQQAARMHRLDRRKVVEKILAGRGDLLVVSGLGSATYDVAAAGDHDRNYYLWGAMGGAAVLGLGLALAQPKVPVLVLTGDGDMLMGMGSLATIAMQAPRNLTIAVLDNERYGETGGQPSHTSGVTRLAEVARGCGIADAMSVETMEDVAALADRVHRLGNGPCFANIAIDDREQPRVLPSRDGAFLKSRLRLALGLAEM